jgi:hypothetical protein
MWVLLLAGCSSSGSTVDGVLSSSLAGADGGTVVVGTPCVPLVENDPTFDGYLQQEVSIETVPAQTSGAAVCLTYHFAGLTSCPYGQSDAGAGPGGTACETTDGMPVNGAVSPQCADRPAASTVVWSCRCANADGRTDDGDAYCNCPPSTTCTQTISTLGDMPNALSGGYCVPTSAAASPTACSAQCDPTSHPCP